LITELTNHTACLQGATILHFCRSQLMLQNHGYGAITLHGVPL